MANELTTIRREAVKSLMAEQNLDFILVLNPGMGNIDNWLFAIGDLPTPAPFNRNSAFLIPADGEILKLCQTTTHPTDRAQYAHFEDAGLEQVLTGGTVGVVHLQCLKKNVRDHLMSVCPNAALKDVTNAFEELKAKKTVADIDGLKAAALEYDRLFCAMSLILRPDRLEKEVVNEIRQRLSRQGAESETPGFHSMVEMTSAPDGGEAAPEVLPWPGRRLCVGDRINVTVRGYIQGFSATLGRSFVLGQPTDEAKQFWDLAVQAQHLAASLAKPGATLGEISRQVNVFLERNGVPADLSGWIHGIGTSVYEAPRNIDASRDMILTEGMVISIGPTIKPPGKDAYRCTDAFAVTEEGALRLSRTIRELREL